MICVIILFTMSLTGIMFKNKRLPTPFENEYTLPNTNWITHGNSTVLAFWDYLSVTFISVKRDKKSWDFLSVRMWLI